METAGKHLRKRTNKKQKWMSEQTLNKIKERKECKKNCGTQNDAYKILAKEVKQLCRNDKKSFLIAKCTKIEDHMKENKSREMYEEINNLTKSFQPRLGVIKDKYGKTLTESEKILGRWKEYCADMYSDDSQINTSLDTGITSEQEESECKTPLRCEIKRAINSLKDRKSPGCDNIHAEMIKASGDEGVEVYHKLCAAIWKSEQWPSDWKRAFFITLPKKLDLLMCSNYRTISLISHASKILLNVLLKRMENKLEEEVSNTQAGFRKNRGTRDHIFNLRMIIQKYREINASLHTCFIDYSKAFDCVNHEQMWQTLKEMNFNQKLINLIRSLYEDQQSAVRLECGTSEWFPVTKGVRQGCILSPQLFSLYTEGIMREISLDHKKDDYEEPSIQGVQLKDLRYADDTALLSTTPTGLEKLIKSVKEHSDEKGLFLNIKKTKIMDIDKCKKEAKIAIDGEEIERVSNFEYLGARIEANGKSTPEIRRRLAMATTRLTKMISIWKGQCKKTKLRVLETVVFPTALYGCEAWTINNTDAKRITSFEMKCYRKILRISWMEKVTNKEVLSRLDMKTTMLLQKAKALKLKYFGHIKRHETLERHILEARIDGRRGRGRPTRRWEQDINDWMDMTTTQAGRLAEDRILFRQKVQEATSRQEIS